MSKEKELAKNTIILTVGKICTQFVGFLLLPLYTTLLLPEEYGIADLIVTYVILIVPLFNWQFDNGLFRFLIDYRDNREQQKKIFSTVVISNIIQSIIFLSVYFLLQFLSTSNYKIFLCLNVMITIFLNTLLQFSRGLGQNHIYAIASFISASLTVVLNVILIAILKTGAYGILASGVIAQCFAIIYLTISQKIFLYFDIKLFDKIVFKKILHYSLPLIPNNISWWAIDVSDRTIVSYVLGIGANGIYTVANKFSSMFITFYNIFDLAWVESVTSHYNEDDEIAYITNTINTMFCLFGTICIGIIACMPFFFPLLVKEQFYTAYYQIPILMSSVLFRVIVGLYSAIYGALKKTAELAKTSSFAAIINIVVDIVLIHFIGVYAASVSTLIAYASMACYRYFHIKRYLEVKLESRYFFTILILLLIIFPSYYYNHLVSNILTLLVVFIVAIVLNKEFLQSALNITIEKLRKG